MSITVDEAYRSPSRLGSDTAEVIYNITGTSDPGAAYNAMLSTAPAGYAGLSYQDAEVTRVNDTRYEGRVHYGVRQRRRATGESEFTFDTTGGTQHITQSLLTVAAVKAGGGLPDDNHQAIGVTREGVEGVDVTVPAFGFTVKIYPSTSSVTGGYVQGLYFLSGCVNSEVVNMTIDGVSLSFQPGELLFLGAAGQKRGNDDWEINLRFAASINRTGIDVSADITIDKDGWDYLWIRYTDDVGDVFVTKKPAAAYVERTYYRDDLNAVFP